MKTGKDLAIFIRGVLILLLARNLSAINPLSHTKCHLEDTFCLTKQAQETLKSFIQGIPELGIKSFEKLQVDYLEVRSYNLHYEMWNITVEGFNNSIIDEISIDMDFKVIRISFHSSLVANFDYRTEGEVYGFPYFGNGKSEIKMNNLQMELVISFEIVKNQQGKDVMNLKSFFYGADAIDGVHYYFGNLFNGNEELSAAVHKLVNDTWRTVVANYGRFFTVKIFEAIYEAVKIFMRSWPLEDLAIYTDTVETEN